MHDLVSWTLCAMLQSFLPWAQFFLRLSLCRTWPPSPLGITILVTPKRCSCSSLPDPPRSPLQLPSAPVPRSQQSNPALPRHFSLGTPPAPHAFPRPGCPLSAKSPWAELPPDGSRVQLGLGREKTLAKFFPMAKTFWEKNRFPPNNRDIQMRASA